MDPNAVVLDISSDEDVGGWSETGETATADVGSGFIGDFDWLSELLRDVEERVDDSDDVVLVREVVLNPNQRLKSSDDDDCVVLDGDPDKPVAIQNDPRSDSDDVLVVGEKGQVACRDFPHSRHLCVNFPFISTPHARHCSQCHCYVCDSLAPCLKWGTGISNNDHCHATEKDEFWKVQRIRFKNSNKAPPPVSGGHDTSPTVGLPQVNPVPAVVSLPNPVTQNQVCRPTAIHPCTSSTNFGIPNIVKQGRTRQAGYVVPRNKFQTHLISQQLLGTSNSTIPRLRRNNVSTLGAQFNSPRAVFKRTGSVGFASTTAQCAYSANNDGSQYSRNPPSVLTPNNGNTIRCQDFSSLMAPASGTHWSSSQPKSGGIAANSVPSQFKISSQPNMRSVFANSMPSRLPISSQPQVYLQPNVGNLESWVPSPPQESFQSYVVPPPPQESSQSYLAPPSPEESSQLYVDGMFVNSLSPQPLPSFSSNAGSMLDSLAICEPLVCSQSSSLSNCSRSVFPQGNESHSATASGFTEFSSSWASSTSQSNQQPPLEISQLQIETPIGEPPFFADFDTQYDGAMDSSSLHFEDWPWGNPSVMGASEAPVPSGLSVLPP